MGLMKVVKSSDIAATEASRAFRAYHRAVQADTYRIASRREEGSTWHLYRDKDGNLPGAKPDDIQWHIIDRLARSKIEHLYFTPLSRSHHIILLDDTNPEKIAAAKEAGIVIAYIQKTSEKSWQALVRIPRIQKSETPHLEPVTKTLEYLASVELAQSLNDEYGDENLTNAIQLHRMPGTPNVKKSRLINGVAHIVSMTEASGGEWTEGRERIRNLMAQLQLRPVPARARRGAAAAAEGVEQGPAAPLYDLFRTDIESNVLRGMSSDVSKTDFMIAVRLRAIGLDREKIAEIIESSTPRAGRRHDWRDYASRTASAAFGPAGDASLQRTQRFHDSWKRSAAAAPGGPPLRRRHPD